MSILIAVIFFYLCFGALFTVACAGEDLGYTPVGAYVLVFFLWGYLLPDALWKIWRENGRLHVVFFFENPARVPWNPNSLPGQFGHPEWPLHAHRY